VKRFILSAVAASMLAVPAVQAAPLNTHQAKIEYVAQKHADKRVIVKKKVVTKKVVRKNQWKRGQKYSAWKRHQSVRDWHRHGLRRPARGQEWIRVGNDYLLVSVVSGVIAGLIAGR
jgi:Ni/Co efflux regulator RcnB